MRAACWWRSSSARSQELPEEQRRVFVAHEIEGRSFKQIAAETGVNVNTLLSRKRYAVLHLRERLQRAFDEFTITRGHKHGCQDDMGRPCRGHRPDDRQKIGSPLASRSSWGSSSSSPSAASSCSWLWNWLLPPLFGVRQVTLWQALGLLALSRILFGGFGRGGGSHDGPRRHHREWWRKSDSPQPVSQATTENGPQS